MPSDDANAAAATAAAAGSPPPPLGAKLKSLATAATDDDAGAELRNPKLDATAVGAPPDGPFVVVVVVVVAKPKPEAMGVVVVNGVVAGERKLKPEAMAAGAAVGWTATRLLKEEGGGGGG